MSTDADAATPWLALMDLSKSDVGKSASVCHPHMSPAATSNSPGPHAAFTSTTAIKRVAHIHVLRKAQIYRRTISTGGGTPSWTPCTSDIVRCRLIIFACILSPNLDDLAFTTAAAITQCLCQ